MICFYCHWPGHKKQDCPHEAEILGIWDTTVPDNNGTCTDTDCFFSPRYELEETVLVAECYASTFGSTDRLEGLGMGRGQGQSSQAETSGTQGRVYTVVP